MPCVEGRKRGPLLRVGEGLAEVDLREEQQPPPPLAGLTRTGGSSMGEGVDLLLEEQHDLTGAADGVDDSAMKGLVLGSASDLVKVQLHLPPRRQSQGLSNCETIGMHPKSVQA